MDFDINYQILARGWDALQDWFVPLQWDSRVAGNVQQGTVRIPDDFVLPDASVGNTPNNPTTVLNIHTGEVAHINGVARPTEGGSIWGYKDDTNPRTHGGSGLIGGQILQSELDQGTIAHAIALNIWLNTYGSNTGGGFVDPAIKADEGFDDPESTEYYGNAEFDIIKMGTRLAIPPSVQPEDINVTSADALKVFEAAKTYGFIIVDNTSIDSIAINTDTEAAASLELVQEELKRMCKKLRVVT